MRSSNKSKHKVASPFHVAAAMGVPYWVARSRIIRDLAVLTLTIIHLDLAMFFAYKLTIVVTGKER